VIFLFIFSFQYLYSDYPADLCTDVDTKKCATKQIEFIAQEFGINFALQSHIQSTLPKIAMSEHCHETSHYLGTLSYKILKSTSLAFSVPKYTLAFCFGAYIHGVTMQYLESVVDQPLDPLIVYQNTCALLKNIPILHRMCAHGLGHGFLVYNHFDVPAALAACMSIVLPKACQGGVFMENAMISLPEWHVHAKDHNHAYYKYGDAFFPCTLVDYKYRDVCYTTASIQTYNEEVLLLKKPLVTAIKNVFVSCKKAAQYQSDCLQGIGEVLGKITKWEPVSLQEACNQGATKTEQQACADGAFTERTITVMQPLDSTVCSDFSGLYQNTCLQHIQKELGQSSALPT